MLNGHWMVCLIIITILSENSLHFRHTDTSLQSQAVSRAAGFENFGIRYMEINIRRLKTRVPQEFLDIEDIGASFQRMSSKTVTKGMDGPGRRNVCTAQVFFKAISIPDVPRCPSLVFPGNKYPSGEEGLYRFQ